LAASRANATAIRNDWSTFKRSPRMHPHPTAR
jgi:hypothetical protein